MRSNLRTTGAGIAVLAALVAADPPSASAADASTPSPAFLLDRGRVETFDAPGAVVETSATGIDATGRIGGGYVDGDRRVHGYLRDRRGRFTTVDVPWASTTETSTLLNFPGSAIGDINDRRQAVGVYSGADGKARGYVLDRGRLETLDVAGAIETAPLGIDDRGDVVGAYVDAGGRLHGFLRDRRNRIETIDVPGAEGTAILDVNVRRQLVGIYADADGGSHGFVLHRGALTTIDVPGTTGRTGVTGIDDLGRIVGQYVDAGGVSHGFRRDTRGRFKPIDVPGARATAPVHLNDLGQIVGNFQRADAQPAARSAQGFLFSRPEPAEAIEAQLRASAR